MACRAWGWLALAVLAGAVPGCADGGSGGGGGGRRDSGRPIGGDGGDGGGTEDECRRDDDCEDDGQFCNGVLICRNGQCISSGIPTCDDSVACTVDSCSATANACQNVPDDSLCPSDLSCFAGVGCSDAPACEIDPDCATGDGMFCNGAEVCVGGRCRSPGMRDCSDPNSCTMDECVEAMQDCSHTPYDFLNDPLHCGLTGEDDCAPCPMPNDGAPHVAAACVEGACGFDCEEGWYDTDGNPANGCECNTPPGTADDPDDLFTDTNCDGIDGDASRAIFVATTGRDTYPGTRAQPKRTLTAGIQAARDAGFDVYVSIGVYTVVETLELANGVSVYGGYDAAANWARSDSTIPQIAGPSVAVRARGLSEPTIVDRIDVVASSNTANGGASIAVHAVDSPGLTWRVSTVQAGQGGPGANGSAGDRGANGGEGGHAIGGVEYEGPACSTNPRLTEGGAGGPSMCGRTGGRGGAGGATPNLGGDPVGGAGSPGIGAPGGGGGGAGGARAEHDGSNGFPGSPGGPGQDGAPGSATGRLSGEQWVAGDGATGAQGGAGTGGGGGGGGGSDILSVIPVALCKTSGDSGAGGGGGACGGSPGTGGGGGGGSIGFLLVRSSVTIEVVEIRTATGGDGGVGGRAGDGGTGGAGGLASMDPTWPGTRDGGSGGSQGWAGGGGAGGGGGRGGHGGGGAGGPSVGILRDGASAISTDLVTYTLGNAGNGGNSPGNAGPRGARMNEAVF